MMSERMWIQSLAERRRKSSDGRKGCLLRRGNMPKQFLDWIWGQVSNGDRQKLEQKNEDARRRSEGMDGGEDRFLGGSDPILSGLAAAQRLRRQGSLPPKLSSRVSRSVAGRVVGDTASRN